MAKPKKYIFDNGVMKINPEYTTWKEAQSGGPVKPSKPDDQLPVAVVSSMGDIADAGEEQYAATGTNLALSNSTAAAIEIIQDEEFTEQFQDPGGDLDGSELLEGLTRHFARFEVPLGLINKLMALQLYHLKFIIDDSGSMNAPTDSMLSDANEHVLRGQPKSNSIPMTRWQEAETRLHNLIDILAFIPTKSIEMRFMNAKNVIYLQRAGKTTEEFANDAHSQIVDNFSTIDVKYKTPTLRVMTESFQSAQALPEPCMHYLLTDGVPSDCHVAQVSELIKNRSNPQGNPVTLISCTNEDQESEWMKEVEEVAPFCSELDDFNDEKAEVEKDQGSGFPYTMGYWLISQLVAAINPLDLDAIDENVPFTKYTMDNLLGRTHTPQEYQYYFERNPHASLYLDLYGRFINEQVSSKSIVNMEEQMRRERKAGYRNGNRMSRPPAPATLASKLASITATVS